MNKEDIRIKHVIVHILDPTIGMPVLSDTELEFGSEVAEFVREHIGKICAGDDAKECRFYERESEVCKLLTGYEDENFVAVSQEIAGLLFEIMSGNIDIPPADLMVVRFREGEEEYLEQMKRALADRDRNALKEAYDRLREAVRESRLNLVFLQEVSYRIHYLLTDLLPGGGAEELRSEPLDWRNQSCFCRFEDWSRQLWEQIDTAFSSMEGREDRNQGITVKDMAERFYVSSAYLGRSFQKATGVPFKQYVNDLRIEEAKRLLRQTDKLIYEIAEETGFAESKYFVAKFTATVGMSPLLDRKMPEKQ